MSAFWWHQCTAPSACYQDRLLFQRQMMDEPGLAEAALFIGHGFVSASACQGNPGCCAFGLALCPESVHVAVVEAIRVPHVGDHEGALLVARQLVFGG
ncbi:hypothetical protein ACH4VR_40310 [Streptomyces sp. NPDC020883]|uniref:hypothetical protein n=1 Tax=Streptomyces sp. NPDC020883 TaxID=3365099 RepID=UPI0037AFDC7F